MDTASEDLAPLPERYADAPENLLDYIGPVISVAKGLQRAFDTGEDADLYILCGGKEVAAHRAIIRSASDMLKKSCSTMRSKNGEMLCMTLDLDNEDLLAVQVVTWFCYFGNYPHLDEDGEYGASDGLRFSLHARVYALATKYELPKLATLARKHFIHSAKCNWDRFCFTNTIPVIYNSERAPHAHLRALIISILKPRLARMMEDEYYQGRFHEFVEQFPLFAQDIFAAIFPKSCQFQAPYVEGQRHLRLQHSSANPAVLSQRTATPPTAIGYTDGNNTTYDAALLQTRSRIDRNHYARLQVVGTTTWDTDLWYEFRAYDNLVGDAPAVLTKIGAKYPKSSLDTAITEFKSMFKGMTGLEWENRFDQPVKGQFTFIRDNSSGMDKCMAKPLLFDVCRKKLPEDFLMLENGAEKSGKQEADFLTKVAQGCYEKCGESTKAVK